MSPALAGGFFTTEPTRETQLSPLTDVETEAQSNNQLVFSPTARLAELGLEPFKKPHALAK